MRELCSRISDVSIGNREVTRVISAEPLPSTPCSSCNHAFEHKIFQGIDHLHESACNLNQRQWAEFSCDALVGAKKFIKQRGLTVEEFLTMVVPERSAELKEVIDVSFTNSKQISSRCRGRFHTSSFRTGRLSSQTMNTTMQYMVTDSPQMMIKGDSIPLTFLLLFWTTWSFMKSDFRIYFQEKA